MTFEKDQYGSVWTLNTIFSFDDYETYQYNYYYNSQKTYRYFVGNFDDNNYT
jgi:hypothetical protein